MADHYYAKSPKVASEPKYWDAELKGNAFRFKTDQGVFSKKEVDFGSRFLIEKFEIANVEGPVLDVGCGYGPIGLSLAKVYSDRSFHLVDVNERAIALAKENAMLNQVENIDVYESDRFNGIGLKNFAAILTNPPIRAGKQVVHDILERSYHHLVPGGELWVVIQKKQGAPSAQVKLEEVFDNVEVVAKRKGYYIIKASKY
ncbi:class I SAM-dependent methyltransferase [Lederbergia lenta]|uniref:16S rRNA m(2)G 1207 methyltransferase n=1 Tax=Lederbergia lenta TaxID=1467 RepID=A0A2X4VX26_LEDLE|nr:class I SAM-dependent methyltransferase [Lederbergia lenta]MCM3113340.1 class I SAM-dependent methyltransferase [Lederbergia lenta]MEC2326301.1 class I SAM-dependent methyltransferase [Lederbergia lenta]SQI51182.1 16S rRNA m(2)G 1207 methyltransferase [Lederbergia lenta]